MYTQKESKWMRKFCTFLSFLKKDCFTKMSMLGSLRIYKYSFKRTVYQLVRSSFIVSIKMLWWKSEYMYYDMKWPVHVKWHNIDKEWGKVFGALNNIGYILNCECLQICRKIMNLFKIKHHYYIKLTIFAIKSIIWLNYTSSPRRLGDPWKKYHWTVMTPLFLYSLVQTQTNWEA